MKPDHDPECHKCAKRMSSADIDTESPMGDSLCIACRKSREESIEEEAVASFCARLRDPVADWYEKIIIGCEWKFSGRVPEDTNERCMFLNYKGAGNLSLILAADDSTAGLFKVNTLNKTDWGISFSLSTPVPIILATIKASVEHESK